jgi:hypothetical protein
MLKVLFRVIKIVFSISIVAAATVTVISYVNPELLVRSGINVYISKLERFYHQELYERRVLVEGLQSVEKNEIEALISPYTTNLSFWFQSNEIVKVLKQNPFVADAQITTCDEGFLTRCFRISIEERAPRFIHLKGPDALLLAEDGVTIAVVPSSELIPSLERMLVPQAPRPKIIAGVITNDASTDQFRARFEYVKESFDMLEKLSGFQFSRLELLPNGELLAKPSKAQFVVQFDKSWGDPKAFAEEVSRLKLLLPEINDRLQEVEKIDLAYNKLAVVSYKTSQVTPTPKPLKK